MTTLRFRYGAAIRNLDLQVPEPAKFQLQSPPAEVEVRNVQPGDGVPDFWGARHVALIVSDVQVPEVVAVTLDRLAHGDLPADVNMTIPPAWTGEPQDPLELLRRGKGPMFRDLPETTREALDNAYAAVAGRLVETVKTLRWVLGSENEHWPFNPWRWEWTIDGTAWNHIPINVTATGSARVVPGMSDEAARRVETLVEAGRAEPLGHELWREAWGQVGTNPRSALILGIAAAEVGFKRFAADLVPDAAWLLSELPSPPLVKMLSEYLPALPVKHRVANRVLRPPKSMRNRLDDGVRLRNDIVHGRRDTATGVEVLPILESVRDLLYLLDYYSGQLWALDRVSTEIRDELNQDAAAPEQ
jgi:hypothetical protein